MNIGLRRVVLYGSCTLDFVHSLLVLYKFLLKQLFSRNYVHMCEENAMLRFVTLVFSFVPFLFICCSLACNYAVRLLIALRAKQIIVKNENL